MNGQWSGLMLDSHASQRGSTGSFSRPACTQTTITECLLNCHHSNSNLQNDFGLLPLVSHRHKPWMLGNVSLLPKQFCLEYPIQKHSSFSSPWLPPQVGQSSWVSWFQSRKGSFNKCPTYYIWFYLPLKKNPIRRNSKCSLSYSRWPTSGEWKAQRPWLLNSKPKLVCGGCVLGKSVKRVFQSNVT